MTKRRGGPPKDPEFQPRKGGRPSKPSAKAGKAQYAKPRGRLAKTLSDDQVNLILAMYQYGITLKQAADSVNIDVKTLYRIIGQDKLAEARGKADAKLAQCIYDKAVNKKDTAALIFLSKVRLQMSEKAIEWKSRLEFERELSKIRIDEQKELIKYKKEIGVMDFQSTPLEIYLSDARTPDADRNALDTQTSH